MSAARKRTAARPPPQTGRSAARRDAAVALALAVLVALVYAQVARHEFVSYDDPPYFVSNPNLDGQFGLDDAIDAFRPRLALWVPLTWISIAIDNALYGVDPSGPLVENAVLHAIASVLLFCALRALSLGTPVSAFAAAVFAAHPLHVESVAWATERKDVLMGVGFCASLLAYARYRERPSPGRYAALFAAAAFAMLAKPAATTLPFALLLLDWWPLRRPLAEARAAVIEKLPLFALSAFTSAMTMAAQTGGMNTHITLSLPYRALSAGRAYADYLADALWPSGLAVFYPYHEGELTDAATIAACAAVALLCVLALAIGHSRRHLFVGWYWFVGMLVPMLGLVQMGAQARADRYMYLPLIGLALAIGQEAHELAQRRPALRRAIAGAGIASVLALGIAAHHQVGYWRNSQTLWRRATAVTRDNDSAHGALGRALHEAGDLAAAEREFLESLRIRSNAGWIRSDLGLVYLDQGRTAEARRELEHALATGGEPALTHSGLGLAAERSGDLPAAIANYRAALRADPHRAEAANNLAWILATAPDPALRDPAEAIALAERSARDKPGDASVLDTLAAAYAAAQRYRDAAAAQERALAALPPDASPMRADFEHRLEQYRAHR
jgi:protein O-mannosyl-transferase